MKMTADRISRLQSALESGAAALITSDSNRFYFTGFRSSAGQVLITRDSATLYIDSRYFEKAKAVVKNCKVELADANNSDIKGIKDKKIKTVFIETNAVSLSEYSRLSASLEGIELSKDNLLDRAIGEMRAVKSEWELDNIRAAQAITDKTFSYICERITAGRTEREVMLDMEFFMRGLGSEGVAFDFIVVSGKNSSLPHGVPTEKKIEKGDFVTMDFGAVIGGYRSDMTRTVAVSSVSEEQKNVYETVLKAQLVALEKIKPGAVCGDIDKTARDIIYGEGYEGCFGHSLGHSVGIDIHESPNLSPNNSAVLSVGNIMTVEPGIYLENRFGVRIEDMVFVNENGHENITKSPKNLIIL